MPNVDSTNKKYPILTPPFILFFTSERNHSDRHMGCDELRNVANFQRNVANFWSQCYDDKVDDKITRITRKRLHMSQQCKLKGKCPLKDKTTVDIHRCWKEDCDGFMHGHCSKLLLDRYEVPVEDRPDGEDTVVFCTKTCYSKWLVAKKKMVKAATKAAESEGKKRKVPWEEDGTLTILLDWLTTEGNYSSYAGSNGNVKGKSKAQYHKEISILIKSKKSDSDREAKDVENKIVSLERQFRVASDWANNTGQGVDNPGDFEAAILRRCPLYKELEPIMGERPNSKPLSTNEDDVSIEDDATTNVEDSGVTAVQQSVEKTPAKKVDSTPSTLSTGSGPSKRLSAASSVQPKKRGKKQDDADSIISALLCDGDGSKEDFHALRVREVSAREREANARMIEADAISTKARMETDILLIDQTVKLLRARKQMIDEGLCTPENIDQFLPMPSKEK
jgi:hypothetical protein